MNISSWFQLIFYMVVLLALAKPLGTYMAKVYEDEHTFLDPVLQPLERLIYRSAGVKADDEMGWKTYAVAMILFNVLGLFVVYALQRLQAILPLNPQGLGAVSPDSSWNTAVSFATNTNWQGYGGETTMSYLSQMLALTVQNFVICGYRYGGRNCHDPGHCASHRQNHRQLLGGFDAHDPVYSSSTRTCRGSRACFTGRSTNIWSL